MLIDSDRIIQNYFRRGYKPTTSSILNGQWQIHPLALLYIQENGERPGSEDIVMSWASEKFGERNLQGLIDGLEGKSMRSGISLRALLEGRKLLAKLKKVRLLPR